MSILNHSNRKNIEGVNNAMEDLENDKALKTLEFMLSCEVIGLIISIYNPFLFKMYSS